MALQIFELEFSPQQGTRIIGHPLQRLAQIGGQPGLGIALGHHPELMGGRGCGLLALAVAGHGLV